MTFVRPGFAAGTADLRQQNMGALEDALAAAHARYTAKLAAPVSFTSPMPQSVLLGTFTPQTDEVVIHVDVRHVFNEYMGAHVWWGLYYGPVQAGNGSLVPKVQGGSSTSAAAPTVAGAKYEKIGAQSAGTIGLSRAIRLTGLTPGQPVQYEVAVNIVGYYGAIKLPSARGWISHDFATQQAPYPDLGYWGAALTSDGTPGVQLLKAQHAVVYNDSLIGAIIPITGAVSGYGQVRMTPDGSRAVASNGAGNRVAVITTGALTGAAAALQGVYIPPGTGPAPHSVAIEPDGLHAWIGLSGLGQVVRMTLADGTFGTPVTLGVSGDAGNIFGRGGLVMSPNGVNLYACNNQAKTVTKIVAATGAVAGSLTLADGPSVATISPDGSTLYVAGRVSKSIYKVRTSDMTLQGTGAIVQQPYAAAIFPDGKSMLFASDAAGAGAQSVQHWRPDTMALQVQWANGSPNHSAADLHINPNGAIYVLDGTAKALNLWFGGQVAFSSNGAALDDDFWSHGLHVLVDMAT